MPKNGNYSECPLTDRIVAYIYREIDGRAELDFETHLADCTTCTDEFAAVSDARFSVYEWKKEAFDTLPTPQFLNPHEVSGQNVGLPAAVRAWLGGLSFPAAAAAAIVASVGIGLIAFMYFGNDKPENAIAPVPPIVQPERPEAVAPLGVTAPEPPETKPVMAVALPGKAFPERPKRVVRRSMPPAQKPVDNYAKKAPALTPDQDPDDHSLRLADLFDAVGG